MRPIMEANQIDVPSHIRKPEVHHDFLWDERHWFAAHGIDVNAYKSEGEVALRWVEKLAASTGESGLYKGMEGLYYGGGRWRLRVYSR